MLHRRGHHLRVPDDLELPHEPDNRRTTNTKKCRNVRDENPHPKTISPISTPATSKLGDGEVVVTARHSFRTWVEKGGLRVACLEQTGGPTLPLPDPSEFMSPTAAASLPNFRFVATSWQSGLVGEWDRWLPQLMIGEQAKSSGHANIKKHKPTV